MTLYRRSLTTAEVLCITVNCISSLSVTTQAPVVVTTDTTLRQLTLRGVANITVYQRILRTLVYTNPAGTLGARNVTITATDGPYSHSSVFTLTIQ